MAEQDTRLDRYFSLVVQEGLFSKHLRRYLSFVFRSIEFEGRRMLEIGGGSGWISFYAACKGARKVVCLEPERQGSDAGVSRSFERLRRVLCGVDQVTLESVTVQDYEPANEKFDIVVLHNSINHLDEEACIRLRKDEQARNRYVSLFERIGRMTEKEGKLVVVDASRYNLFGCLGLRNPFVPEIEWDKHQSPKYWATLLSAAQFSNAQIRWMSFNRLGDVGEMLLANGWAAFLLHSYFCLTMVRK
jgi:SAM-dependent methyltransferase